MARQLSRCFDSDPSLKPPPNQRQHDNAEIHHIALSKTQEAQIREMFNLFDTDGGGSIDRKELDFALDALGFQEKKSMFPSFPTRNTHKAASSSTKELMDSIMSDGAMTLEEFSTVMMGEITSQSPMEDVQAVFSLLSRADGCAEHDNLITLSKLHTTCNQFKVQSHFLRCWADLGSPSHSAKLNN